VASYLVEGGPSRNFTRIKALMHGEPEIWSELVDRLTDLALASLRSQLDAGASAVQVFDSWAGILAPHHYEELVLPATRRLFAELGRSHPGVPTILFGVGTGELLGLMATAGSDVVGIDWRVPLDQARLRVGPGLAVQGNLDPASCVVGWPVAEAETRDVLRLAGTAPGHIFNLGHGVLPETDPAILERVVELVHAEGRAGVGAP
jgi:uroporphyrinogen decarboxylase